jgi:hypothetical protein
MPSLANSVLRGDRRDAESGDRQLRETWRGEIACDAHRLHPVDGQFVRWRHTPIR